MCYYLDSQDLNTQSDTQGLQLSITRPRETQNKHPIDLHSLPSLQILGRNDHQATTNRDISTRLAIMSFFQSPFTFLLRTILRNFVAYLISQATYLDLAIGSLVLIAFFAFTLAILQVTSKAFGSVSRIVLRHFLVNFGWISAAAILIGILKAAVQLIVKLQESSAKFGNGSQDAMRRWYQ